MIIQVPATSANLGPGFDSCGVAVSRYLTIEVKEQQEAWYIEHQLGENIPTDETNLLLTTARKICPSLQPHRLIMKSEIPLARGLGSSSSVIVAGIELANQLGNLQLDNQMKLELATAIEGHPDNVAPAILGDFVVSAYFPERTTRSVLSVKQSFPTCGVIAYIPKEELLTKTSRNVLPEAFPFKEAVEASAIANVMVAAIVAGDLALAGEMMTADRWHEPYRDVLVPHLKKLKQTCLAWGAYACFLSGAGPTVLILTPVEQTDTIIEKLNKMSNNEAEIIPLTIDRRGIKVSE